MGQIINILGFECQDRTSQALNSRFNRKAAIDTMQTN